MRADESTERGDLPSEELIAAMKTFTPELREREERLRAKVESR